MDKALLNKISNQKGSPCVTMVVATSLKSFDDKEKIQLKIKNILKQLTEDLNKQYPQKTTKKITTSIQFLVNKVNFNHLKKGLGFYVSDNFSEIVSFPLDIKDKLLIHNSFDVTDIESTLDKMVDYAILLLGKNKTRFFSGTGNVLSELKNEHFPTTIDNDYEVYRSSPHSLYNGEESKIDRARVINFFRRIDQLIPVFAKDIPIVLLGTKSHLSEFKSISKHTKQFVGEVDGNYDKHSLHEISRLVWSEFEGYLNATDKKVLN